MPRRRAVFHRRSLIAALAVSTLVGLFAGGYSTVEAAGPARIVTPGWRDVVLGETKFQFAVEDHEPDVDRIDVFVAGRLAGSAMRPDWSFRWEAPPGAGERQIVAVVYAGDAVIDRFHIKTRKVGATQEVDVSLVQLYPVVVDRRGRFVKGLELADFDVLDQGRPVEVQNFAERTSDSSLALLLDVSQSMEEKIGVVRTACARFVDQLGDRHATSLYAFNHGLQRLAPLERNPGAVKAAVAGLTAGGGTALYDALIQVFDDLKRISGRRAVVVFSDGRDERSLSSWDAVARAGRAGDVIIYAVGTQSNEDSRRSRDDLVSMAEETGGRAFFIKRAEDLRGVLADILLDLDAQYVLSYPPPEGPAGTRAVEVRTADGKYKVRCRQQYVYGGR